MNSFESIASRIPKWIRWPFVPITAIITAVAVWSLATIAAKVLVFFSDGRGWGENFFQYLLIPGFGAYCSVAAGTLMAPKFRQWVSLLLSAAWTFAAGVITFFSIVSAVWTTLIAVASVCVGCAIAASVRHFDPKDSASLPEALPESAE